jgi:hypothetical protein
MAAPLTERPVPWGRPNGGVDRPHRSHHSYATIEPKTNGGSRLVDRGLFDELHDRGSWAWRLPTKQLPNSVQLDDLLENCWLVVDLRGRYSNLTGRFACLEELKAALPRPDA